MAMGNWYPHVRENMEDFFQPGLKCFLSFLYCFSYKSKRGDDQAPFDPPNAVAARKDTG